MRKREIFKILAVNLIALACIFSTVEFLAYSYDKKMIPLKYKLPYIYGEDEAIEFLNYPIRFQFYDYNFESNKKPILLLGGSYALGEGLAWQDSPCERLKKLTNRWVYNHARSAADPMYNLIIMEKEDEVSTIDEKKPEYVIYVYMFHHLQRLLEWKYYNLYRKHGFIENQPYNPLYNLHSYAYIKNRTFEKSLRNDPDFKNHLKLFYNVMNGLKNKTQQLYPGSKFIVLIYDDINADLTRNLWRTVEFNDVTMQKLFDIMYSSEFKKGLEDLGIEVVTTEELIGRKMDNLEQDRLQNDPNHPHPSASAWAEIIPKFVKRIGL